MTKRYQCQINFLLSVEAENEQEASKMIYEQATSQVANLEFGFTFKRESDGKVFLAVDGKAVRIPQTIGAPPAPAFNPKRP